MHFALLPNLLQRHVDGSGPCSCSPGGIQRCQCRSPAKAQGRGLRNESMWCSAAPCASDAVRACSCPRAQQQACAKLTSISLGPVLQRSWVSSFEIMVLSIKILWAQIYVFPCKGCTVLTDYPDSLDSNYWSHLMGSIRNAAFCSMTEISSASSCEGGGAADSPACQDDAQCAISWLGLCTYPLTTGGLCFIPAMKNVSTFLPFRFPGRGMCYSILIPPFNLHLKGFHQSCFQLMLLLFQSHASY